MRMKMVCDDRTLREVANEFLALKKAQKVRERTLNDYKKYIDKFLEQVFLLFTHQPRHFPKRQFVTGTGDVGSAVRYSFQLGDSTLPGE